MSGSGGMAQTAISVPHGVDPVTTTLRALHTHIINLERQLLFEIAVGGIQTTTDDGTIEVLKKMVQDYDELEDEINDWKATMNSAHDTLGDLNYHFDLGDSHREIMNDMGYLERSSGEQYHRLRSIKATKRDILKEITRVREPQAYQSILTDKKVQGLEKMTTDAVEACRAISGGLPEFICQAHQSVREDFDTGEIMEQLRKHLRHAHEVLPRMADEADFLELRTHYDGCLRSIRYLVMRPGALPVQHHIPLPRHKSFFQEGEEPEYSDRAEIPLKFHSSE